MIDFTSAVNIAVGCVMAANMDTKTKSQVIESLREMEKQIEKLEEQNIAQHNMIEALGERNEWLTLENHELGVMIVGENE